MRNVPALLVLLGVIGMLRGENIEFPANAGIINVRLPPYSARGDGVTDDTEALQQALVENGNANKIIYLPNGVYIVSDTLRWPGGTNAATRYRATILQGQSRAGTTLRLADYSAGFQNAGKPRPILWTGERGGVRWRNAIRNLTIDSGVHNPAAIGIQFFTQKQGGIRDVTIRARDEDGAAGIDMTHSDEVGPTLLKNIRIEGFDVGIRTSYAINGITGEHLEFVGQIHAAIHNSGQTMSLRDVRSTNSCTAIYNMAPAGSGYMTLIDATLQHVREARSAPSALHNKGLFFARNLTTPGYSKSIENLARPDADASGPDVPQFNSHRPFSLYAPVTETLKLPVTETPDPGDDPLDRWISPLDFGGHPDDDESDDVAIQKAIDAGKSTLYLPNGTWVLRKPVFVRGNIRRIIGCEARLRLDLPIGQPALVVTNGSSDRVWIERLASETVSDLVMTIVGGRNVVISSCAGLRARFEGKGEVHLEDVYSTLGFQFGERKVWARQVWIEFEGTKIQSHSGFFWGLGVGGDRTGTFLSASKNSQAELLGGLIIASGPWKDMPLIHLEDSNGSFILAEASFNNAPFQTLVEDRRGNITKKLGNRGLPGEEMPFHAGGHALPLYVGSERR